MENKSLVTFVLPTYNRHKELRMALSCLQTQTDENWKAIVVVDDSSEHMYSTHPEMGNLLFEDWLYNDDRIRVQFMNQRSNNWGHTPREIGKIQSETKYVIMSGDDNYYIPTFVEELHKMSKDLPGMIYWDMVHSHYDYQYFKCVPAFNQIDMGAFATRTDLAHQIKLSTSYAADGEFVEEFKKRFPNEKILKINKTLFVHN